MNPFHLVLAGGTHTGDCWPGFAPAGEVLFFASPKKSTQKKSEPAVCVPKQSFGQPVVLALTGVSLELGYRLKQSRALIRSKLCSSAQTEGPQTAQSARLVALRATLPGERTPWLSDTARAKQSAESFAAVEAGLSSAGAGGKRAGDCLSEASSSQTPPDTSSARHRAAARTSARFSFAYFSLAKQRKVSGRRAIPGQRQPADQPAPAKPRNMQAHGLHSTTYHSPRKMT